MKAWLKLQLGALQQVTDTTPDSADHFSLKLDFRGVDLELELARAIGGTTEAPAAWNKLHEALQELAALAAEYQKGGAK